MGEKGKLAIFFVTMGVVWFLYYLFIDWFLMVVIQNLPFPYRG